MNKKILPFLLPCITVFAEDGVAPTQNPMGTLLLIGIACIFFYFFLFRPEQKKRKALEAKRNNLKKGDKVLAVGIIGTVDDIRDTTFVLTMVDGGKIEVIRGAISEVFSKKDENP